MRPIRPGDRGPAVEDIQRRLLVLGYDLGPTGVDGVFLGRTADAVREFQSRAGVAEDALVGDETWAALVDETFALGDRMLYLRLPYLHGKDVRLLQGALSSLGFACGHIDGIFGAFTERATAEFQRNAGLGADGIAGDDTIRAVWALRHVWEGKDHRAHSAAVASATRRGEVLARIAVCLRASDEVARDVAGRVVNLAEATTHQTGIRVSGTYDSDGPRTCVAIDLCSSGTVSAVPGRPVVTFAPDDTFAARLLTALEASRNAPEAVVIDMTGTALTCELEVQRAAVDLLDALCVVFD